MIRAASFLLTSLLLAACARQPRPAGTLLLNAAAPVIEARIDGMDVRLRVDPAQNGAVELTPEFAARLAGPFAPGRDIDVGRTLLRGRVATAKLELGGQATAIAVETHDRAMIDGVDGVIGPEELPYAVVRWRRAGAPVADGMVALPIEISDAFGLSAAAPELPTLRLRFAPAERSSATAAAGVLLAAAWQGRLDATRLRIPLLFGVERPARMMHFSRPGTLARFPITSLPVRAFDFAGDTPPLIASSKPAPGEILVAHDLPRQREWRAVTLGGDLLSRCAEFAYDRAAHTLTLRCDFAGARE